MAAKGTFTFEGLDEFKDDIEKMYKEYPEETEKEIYRLAGVFTKDVNKKMPDSYSDDKKSMKKAWKRTREKETFTGFTVGVEVKNVGKLFHLVENGHEVKGNPQMAAAVLSGGIDSNKKASKKTGKKRATKVLGWSQGKHYAQDTRDEWNSGQYAAYIKKFLDKMRKKHNL